MNPSVEGASPTTMPTIAAVREIDALCARRWFALAVSILILAGVFALLLVVGRMPPFDRWVPDPAFFKRCLVVHVDLALVLWFGSCLGGLLFLLPTRPTAVRLAGQGAPLAAAGVLLLCAGAFLPGSRPVLANYVPMIDHWLFGLGLLAFGAGLLAVVLSRGLGQGTGWCAVPPCARIGAGAAAVALALAGATLFSSWLALPAGLAPREHYELLFWGAGHVLQLGSVIAMLVAWLLLATAISGKEPLSARAATWLFGLLTLPWLCSPLLAAAGTWTPAYRLGFTRLMQWGLFPAVLIALVACARALRPLRLRDWRQSALLASFGLTLFGFLLGAAIRGSTTVVPAHYHASIGAVTVALMGACFLLAGPLGCRLPAGRLGAGLHWQPLLYASGQLLFALGFAFAGAHGAARKAYGAEQALRSGAEVAGMFVMGLGGFVAIAGGLWFLVVALAAARRRAPRALAVPACIPLT
jgi:hypothetical protein